MTNQTQLFEPPFVRPPLPKIFIYRNLNINQKINLHSNTMYAPVFANRYSFIMGTQNVYKSDTDQPNPDYRSGH